MNKRLRKKIMKRFFDENLNKKIYMDYIQYDNPCKRCSSDPSCFDVDGYNCKSECDGIGDWFKYRFNDKMLDNMICNFVGKIYIDESEEDIQLKFKYLGYFLDDYYNIRNYKIRLGEDVISREVPFYNKMTKIFGEKYISKYTKDFKPYILISKIN